MRWKFFKNQEKNEGARKKTKRVRQNSTEERKEKRIRGGVCFITLAPENGYQKAQKKNTGRQRGEPPRAAWVQKKWA